MASARDEGVYTAAETIQLHSNADHTSRDVSTYKLTTLVPRCLRFDKAGPSTSQNEKIHESFPLVTVGRSAWADPLLST